MRVENIHATINIPIDFTKPDCNGVIYPRDVIEEAMKEPVNMPFVFVDDDGNRHCLGVVTDMGFCGNDLEGIISADVALFGGGTCENITFKDGVQRKIAKSINIFEFGLSR